MIGTQPRPALLRYQDTVVDLMETGEEFVDVEDAINEITNLSDDQKAALWLVAFSLRERCEQQREARHLLALVS